MTIELTPVGTVHNDHPPKHKPLTWQGVVSEIVFEPRWTEALSGLDGFSHAAVICYLHLTADQVSPARIHPQGRPEMPLVGFFGTRTPARPNPLSLTVVEVVQREANVLTVRNLDMYDGTAVLDVKPYLVRGDCHPAATEPDWIHQLRAIHDRERQG